MDGITLAIPEAEAAKNRDESLARELERTLADMQVSVMHALVMMSALGYDARYVHSLAALSDTVRILQEAVQ